jgi:hypothetical protein
LKLADVALVKIGGIEAESIVVSGGTGGSVCSSIFVTRAAIACPMSAETPTHA